MHARLAGLALAVTTTLMLAAPAAAAVNPTHYEDSTAFHALGAIHQVTNFDASEPDGAPALSDPFVDGDLTILGGPHVVGKFFAPYLPVRNAASFTDPTPLQVAIDAPGYTLLSFDLGDLSGDAAVTLWLFTDKSGYGIGIAAPDARQPSSSTASSRPTESTSPASASRPTTAIRSRAWRRSSWARSRPSRSQSAGC